MPTKKHIKTTRNNTLSGLKTNEGKNRSTVIAKKLTEMETKNFIKKYFKAECDPDQIFQNAAKNLEAYLNADKNEVKQREREMIEVSDKALMPLGLETHYALAETIDARYRPLVIEIARQIEKEYDCKTTSEKILAETIAGTYGKIIEYSKDLNSCTKIEYLSNEKNGYYTMLSKELDRAHRQLISALTTLRQVKSPPFELNITAKTAFLAQNQQINALNKQIQTNETINPK